MSNAKTAVALRTAAVALAEGIKAPVVGSDDREFKKLDRCLGRAAVAYTRGMTKRGYSREFTPRSERRIKIEIDRVPPTLADTLRAKAKRDGISIRALTLTLWKQWLAAPAPETKE